MAVMDVQSTTKFDTNLAKIDDEISHWDELLSNVEDQISKGDGSKFAKNYPKGKKACNHIKQIVEQLRLLKKQINTLISEGEAFIAKAGSYEGSGGSKGSKSSNSNSGWTISKDKKSDGSFKPDGTKSKGTNELDWVDLDMV